MGKSLMEKILTAEAMDFVSKNPNHPKVTTMIVGINLTAYSNYGAMGVRHAPSKSEMQDAARPIFEEFQKWFDSTSTNGKGVTSAQTKKELEAA
jgi:hypothetical protein